MPFSDYGYFAPSKPRKADGIKARSARGAIGTTWWSKRFTGVLETFGMGTRLTRGRSYARSGQVLGLDVVSGVVKARVQGSRKAPYKVSIGLPELTEEQWRKAEESLADDALHCAQLLAGVMPPEIEALFARLKVPLFPASAHELSMDCSCPDWAVPCKHIAAVFYILAEAFDDDPFRILAWRGRDREVLLARLRELRGGSGHDDDFHDAAESGEPPLGDLLEHFWELGANLPVPHAAVRSGPADLVLRRLDDPAVTVQGMPLADLLRPAYQKMVEAQAR
jgi:uncharacterized Zn finger protein